MHMVKDRTEKQQDEYARRMFLKQYQWRNGIHGQERSRQGLLIGTFLMFLACLTAFYLAQAGW